MNEKTIPRPIRAYPADTAACETWLADMAAKGLHLAQMGLYLAYFKQGAPAQGVRFRFEPLLDDGWLSQADRDLYAEAGWEYIDTWEKTYRIFRADDPAAPELHSDPATQALTLRRLLRRQGTAFGVILGTFVLLFAGLLWLCVDSSFSPLIGLVEHAGALLFCLALPICFVLLDRRSGFLHLLRLRRALQNGQEMGHAPVRRFAPPMGLVSLAIYLLMLVVNGYNLFAQPVNYRTIERTEGLPFVSLAALEGEGFAYHVDARRAENYFYSYERGLLWTRTQQGGEVEGSGRDSQLYITRYRLPVRGLADAVYAELPKTWAIARTGAAVVPLEADCDRAAIARCEDAPGGDVCTVLMLQSGSTVLYVTYAGEADLNEQLDAFTALLD